MSPSRRIPAEIGRRAGPSSSDCASSAFPPPPFPPPRLADGIHHEVMWPREREDVSKGRGAGWGFARTRQGRGSPGLLERQADQDLIALDPPRVSRDVLDRRRPRGLAAGQVELAAVARTFDRLTVDLALRQGTAVVRTDVGDGEVGPGDVEDRH